MTLTQMEQTQAQGWFGCALGMTILVASTVAMGVTTGPVGAYAMAVYLGGTVGATESCLEAVGWF